MDDPRYKRNVQGPGFAQVGYDITDDIDSKRIRKQPYLPSKQSVPEAKRLWALRQGEPFPAVGNNLTPHSDGVIKTGPSGAVGMYLPREGHYASQMDAQKMPQGVPMAFPKLDPLPQMETAGKSETPLRKPSPAPEDPGRFKFNQEELRNAERMKDIQMLGLYGPPSLPELPKVPSIGPSEPPSGRGLLIPSDVKVMERENQLGRPMSDSEFSRFDRAQMEQMTPSQLNAESMQLSDKLGPLPVSPVPPTLMPTETSTQAALDYNPQMPGRQILPEPEVMAGNAMGPMGNPLMGGRGGLTLAQSASKMLPTQMAQMAQMQFPAKAAAAAKPLLSSAEKWAAGLSGVGGALTAATVANGGKSKLQIPESPPPPSAEPIESLDPVATEMPTREDLERKLMTEAPEGVAQQLLQAFGGNAEALGYWLGSMLGE